MILLAAAAIASAPPVQNRQPGVAVEAIATVRIVAGVRLKLDSLTNADAPRAHDTTIQADGTRRPARLIEFE